MENEAILERIKIIHAESKGRYCASKIHQLLKKEGFSVSLKRVQRLMKTEGIRSVITKKYRPTSSGSQIKKRDNLLEQDFETTTINEKWVADITYIHTVKNGWSTWLLSWIYILKKLLVILFLSP